MLKELNRDSHVGYSRDPEAFYSELTRRNSAFIPSGTQARLRKLKVLVAGCGSTGGACTQSLARVGVTQFILADNGSYELNNLNRQHAYLDDLGRNKAEFHAEQIRRINPFAEVQVFPEGVSESNVDRIVEWADLIMDGVDVTTRSGITMKIKLHESAKSRSKPVLTALDLGFKQWGKSYDYRDPAVKVLDGKAEEASRAEHPLKALFTIVPLSSSPAHCLPLIRDILLDEELSASQLGCTSDLLSAIIVPSAIRFVEQGELVPGWNIDLQGLAYPLRKRIKSVISGFGLRREIARLLNKLR